MNRQGFLVGLAFGVLIVVMVGTLTMARAEGPGARVDRSGVWLLLDDCALQDARSVECHEVDNLRSVREGRQGPVVMDSGVAPQTGLAYMPAGVKPDGDVATILMNAQASVYATLDEPTLGKLIVLLSLMDQSRWSLELGKQEDTGIVHLGVSSEVLCSENGFPVTCLHGDSIPLEPCLAKMEAAMRAMDAFIDPSEDGSVSTVQDVFNGHALWQQVKASCWRDGK